MPKDKMLTKKGKAVFTPDPETPSVIAGSLCRFVVALCGAFGVCLMLNDGFHFTGGLDALFVFFTCAVSSIIAYVLAVSLLYDRKVFTVLTVLLSVGLFMVINGGIGVEVFFYYAPVAAWNKAITSLSDAGFSSLAYFMINVSGSAQNMPDMAERVRIAFSTVCALISFVFVHSTVRKVRLIPPIVAAASVMTVCFTYNTMNENFAFLCIVAAGTGLIALKYSGSFTAVKTSNGAKDNDRFAYFKRASISGVAGVVAAALVFAVGAYPAAKLKEPIGEFKALESLISAARVYMYDIISGNRFTPSDYTAVSAGSTPVKPLYREFKNIRLFTVRTQSEVPIYLRSWIGDDFSSGRWALAVPGDLPGETEYMPEDTSELFYTILGINENLITEDKLFDGTNVRYGFVSSYISLANVGFGTNMIYLPSRFSTHYGLLEYSHESAFEKYDAGYSVKHNGMITLFRVSEPSYAAVAHLPFYQATGFRSSMDKAIEEYVFTVENIQKLPELYSWNRQVTPEEISAIKEAAEEQGIKISARNIINYLDKMAPSELNALSEKLRNADYETNYAKAKYTAVPESETWYLYDDVRAALGDLSDVYFPDSPATASYSSQGGIKKPDRLDFDTVYKTVYKVVTYLAGTAEYTLEPYGYNDQQSYIYQFLHTAKNGYCTQYATAAVLMLRMLGIPARYVEGFKTSDIYKLGGAYRSVIRDSDAHAWLEVYVEGPGWMTFEATEPMLDSMFGSGPYGEGTDIPGDDTLDPEITAGHNTGPLTPDTSAWHADTAPVTEPDTEPGTTVVDPPVFRLPPEAIIIPVVIFAILSAIFAYLLYRKKKLEKFTYDLRKAAKGETKDPYADTVRFCDYIFTVLEILGQKRKKNELMSDFVARAETALGVSYLQKGADAAQKTVFSGTADAEDCKNAAECAISLQITARVKLKGFRKFLYRTLRKTV